MQITFLYCILIIIFLCTIPIEMTSAIVLTHNRQPLFSSNRLEPIPGERGLRQFLLKVKPVIKAIKASHLYGAERTNQRGHSC